MGFTGGIHTHRGDQQIIRAEPAHHHPGLRENFNIREIILGIKPSMMDGLRVIVHFPVFDPVVRRTIIKL